MATIGGNSFKIEIKNLPAIVKDIKQFGKDLERIGAEEMEKMAISTKAIVLERFDKTAKYSKPWKRTDRIRNALDSHVVLKTSTYIDAGIGQLNAMPFYWIWQDLGTDPYQFEEKYVPVRKKSASGSEFISLHSDSMHGASRSQREGVYWISYNKAWFAANPDRPFIQITVSHPGIQARGFVSAGRAFVLNNFATMANRVVDRALGR